MRLSEFTGYDDTLEWALKEAAKHHLHFITAFDDERIMAGNGGTLAMEILEDIPDAHNFLIPVGGGGLAGGMAYYAKSVKPDAQIFGCQHIDSPAFKISLHEKKAATRMPAIDTVAGAIEGGMGEKCFAVLQHLVSDVLLVSEEQIIKGFTWMLENHQYLLEPASAVPIACCLFHKMPHLQHPTVLVLSGRNVSYPTLQRLTKK